MRKRAINHLAFQRQPGQQRTTIVGKSLDAFTKRKLVENASCAKISKFGCYFRCKVDIKNFNTLFGFERFENHNITDLLNCFYLTLVFLFIDINMPKLSLLYPFY